MAGIAASLLGLVWAAHVSRYYHIRFRYCGVDTNEGNYEKE